jgi:hypothetical protein
MIEDMNARKPCAGTQRAPGNLVNPMQLRVFISSTFRDMHAERDHLLTVVFPELRERLERLGLEFFDVDLRWGVPAKDVNGETANWRRLANLLTAASPNAFVLPGRCVQPPGAEDSYCGNPMLLSCSAHE